MIRSTLPIGALIAGVSDLALDSPLQAHNARAAADTKAVVVAFEWVSCMGARGSGASGPRSSES
jgi:hypothetical protein